MKKVILLSIIGLFLVSSTPIIASTSASAEYSTELKGKKSVKVSSYKKKNGTTVKSHKRSKPSRK